jgi:hypothetical protein
LKNTALQEELEVLRSAGDAATRSLQDNVNAIMATLEAAVPQNLRHLLSDAVTSTPRADIEKDYRRKFLEAERYTKYLAKFRVLAEASVASMPNNELVDATPNIAPLSAADMVAHRLDKIERVCRLAEWYETEGKRWSDWWEKLTPAENFRGPEPFLSSTASEQVT